MLIRPATPADAPALLAIYAPYVETTAVSFETVAPDAAEFARRIATALADWQWLVAEKDERCVGYAYGSAHRARAAYRWSVDVSAYVHPNHHRAGTSAGSSDAGTTSRGSSGSCATRRRPHRMVARSPRVLRGMGAP